MSLDQEKPTSEKLAQPIEQKPGRIGTKSLESQLKTIIKTNYNNKLQR